jgi:hypothetical protein
MIRALSCILLVFVLFSACKKEEKTYDVYYKIVVDGTTSGYTVRYTLPDGSTSTKGLLTNAVWTSPKQEGFKRGFPVSLTLESGGGNYVMQIFISGSLGKQRNASGGGSSTLETQTPY